MEFSIKDFLDKSFVIVKDAYEFRRFCKRMSEAGFSTMPCKYIGLYPPGLVQCESKSRPSVFCALSHYVLINMAKTMDWPCVTIFESDAYPMNGCAAKLEKLFSQNGIPDKADLITFGNINFIRQYDNGTMDNCLYDVSHGYGRIRGNIWGAHAVVVFRKGYDLWLANYLKHDREFHADWFNDLVPNAYSTDRSYFIQVKDRLQYASWIRDKQYLSDFPSYGNLI